MTIFDMLTNPPAPIAQRLSDATDDIADQYFTVDTASADVVGEWVRFNRHMVTYALKGEQVTGFFNMLPLTQECGELFARQAIKEEDLRVEDILPHEALKHAQYAYIAAIAVSDTRSYLNRQCAAALVSCLSDLLLHGYGPALKRVYANPTTFNGNRMVRKLGLRPLDAQKRSLKENDIYAVDMNDAARKGLQNLSGRYARFVGANPWKA